MFLQMQIHLHLLHQSVKETEGEAAAVKDRFGLMHDAMVAGGEDDLVAGIVVERGDKGIDVMSLYHMHSLLLSYDLACHLASIAIEALQIVAYRAIQTPDALYSRHLCNRSLGIILRNVGGLEINFVHFANGLLYLQFAMDCDAIEHKDIWLCRSTQRHELLLILGNTDCYLFVDVCRQCFLGLDIIPG